SERQNDQACDGLRFHWRRGVDGKKKTVAAARQRLDEPGGVGGVTQGLTDLADTEVQSLLKVDEGALAPDALTDVGTTQNLSAAANQQLEELERLRRQLDAFAVSSKLARACIELKCIET